MTKKARLAILLGCCIAAFLASGSILLAEGFTSKTDGPIDPNEGESKRILRAMNEDFMRICRQTSVFNRHLAGLRKEMDKSPPDFLDLRMHLAKLIKIEEELSQSTPSMKKLWQPELSEQFNRVLKPFSEGLLKGSKGHNFKEIFSVLEKLPDSDIVDLAVTLSLNSNLLPMPNIPQP